eukprot:1153778-Pelagomonas_calceolata.AAC.1
MQATQGPDALPMGFKGAEAKDSAACMFSCAFMEGGKAVERGATASTSFDASKSVEGSPEVCDA